ncbi:Alpha/Beta hydrolase protein [Paraphoma chrysanthemicola]|uniref:Alpha/Beta hydrolase protein n=1 Tax=Paraphoma chrysanthemicola TaxID=798071 RepID=A0A8K0RAN3_9PLEO|nr:Alpha/Beta hydrolase protein [Paraphoma chrysanthemicola]
MKLTLINIAFAHLTSVFALNKSQCFPPSDQGSEMGLSGNETNTCEQYLDVEHKRRGFRFNREEHSIFYTVQGSGDPVLLLHGWTCDQTDWIFQIPFLLNHGFQVIAIDHRGHGRSLDLLPTNPVNSSALRYDPRALADDAAAILAHLGIGGDHDGNRKAAIVMGHSLGGVVTAELAYRHKRLVRGIVLVDPAYLATGSRNKQIVEGIKASPEIAPEWAAEYFEQVEATTAKRPPWMGAWLSQRIWGMPAHVVVSTVEQLANYLSNWSTGVDYMRERKVVPRLATYAHEIGGADIEQAVGLGEEDRVETIPFGHWLHQVDSERFNAVVEEWFRARGFLPAA